ncbi:MAG: zinc ribbon domain-containing protein [Acidimicrobiales bacterium]|nr:zinc ribbon domain-containing protein [Acidimicrobiales bacterium]
MSYLSPGLPAPVAARDGFDAPFWDGLANDKLLLQRCQSCERWQWGAEWVCHRCRSFDLTFEETEATGIIYSHQRVWHPVHPALKEHGPFVIVLVELPHADNVRLVGNLIGDPHQSLDIGAPVTGVFEHHLDNDPVFTLLQWAVGSS